MGLLAVASGEMDAVLVVGVEKLTESLGKQTTSALATAADADYEVVQGVSFVGLNALVMQRYMYEYGYDRHDFAPFALNAHANGAKNPNALFRSPSVRKPLTRAVSWPIPISLFDASPIGDGAAALLLVPVAKAPEAVRVIGSASAIDTLAIHDREDPLWLKAAEQSATRAYQQAGIGPEDVDLFELHDAFSIMAALIPGSMWICRARARVCAWARKETFCPPADCRSPRWVVLRRAAILLVRQGFTSWLKRPCSLRGAGG